MGRVFTLAADSITVNLSSDERCESPEFGVEKVQRLKLLPEVFRFAFDGYRVEWGKVIISGIYPVYFEYGIKDETIFYSAIYSD